MIMREKIKPNDKEIQEYLAYKNDRDVISNWKKGIDSIQNINDLHLNFNCILVCGGMAAFDLGLMKFLCNWNKLSGNLFLLSEVTAEYRRYTKKVINFPYICTPHLLSKEIFIHNMKIPVTYEMCKLIKEKKYIKDAVFNCEGRQKTLGNGYAVAWSYYAYLYINKLLDKINPSQVVLWNEFYAFHQIFKGICDERKIKLLFMEFGCIPGTVCVESMGQQGESEIAKNPNKFMEKKVSVLEINKTKIILMYLKKSGLNRNVQPKVLVDKKMFYRYLPERKVITYFGQNDFESGMYPYSETSKKYHSPIFKSSLDALKFLELLAIRNNWNFIYKPHPIMLALNHEGNLEFEHTRINIVTDVNINSLIDFSDVIITILSQSAYLSLIRNKPVLMIGYTQLRGKGCCYEAYLKNDIQESIFNALKNGFILEQKEMFNKHVTQLLKYYLYDDTSRIFLKIGQRISKNRQPQLVEENQQVN